MSFSAIADFYDTVNGGAYLPYADFLERAFKQADIKVNEVLDLGCGTGGICAELANRGFDMVALDISPEMLNVAREKNFGKNTLLLCQDMREFELYGTVDACVCCLDSINYLTKLSDVKKCFSLVHNYLIPDGVFIFDVNTPYRFENVYSNNDYILENDGSLLAWHNEYNKKSKICKFYLSIFDENEDGLYERSDEIQKEKCYSLKQIKAALSECGFEILRVYGDLDKNDAADTNEKWYFVARCIKNKE